MFEGIISDLFPGVVLPTPDYAVFLEAIHNNSKHMKLQAVPFFVEKIIQVEKSKLSRMLDPFVSFRSMK